MQKILLLYTPGDMHGEAVRWSLRSRDIECDVWHLSEFPAHRSASIYVSGEGIRHGRFGVSPGDGRLDKYDVIWMRRKGVPTLASDLHNADRAFAKHEANIFIQNLRAVAGHEATHWINEPSAAARANHKLRQLIVARQCGFDIPPTLVSNDADDVVSFAQKHGPHIVMKPFGGAQWQDKVSGAMSYSLTTELSAEDLSNRRSIEVAPAIYQKRVDIQFELRVTAFGGQLLAARINSQERGRATDWRHDVNYGDMPIHAFTLPAEVADRCLELLKALGLKFGCLDLAVTQDNQYVFLEVNEAGQFLWVEEMDIKIPLLREFSRYMAGLAGVHDAFEDISYAQFMDSDAFETAMAALEATTNPAGELLSVE